MCGREKAAVGHHGDGDTAEGAGGRLIHAKITDEASTRVAAPWGGSEEVRCTVPGGVWTSAATSQELSEVGGMVALVPASGFMVVLSEAAKPTITILGPGPRDSVITQGRRRGGHTVVTRVGAANIFRSSNSGQSWCR